MKKINKPTDLEYAVYYEPFLKKLPADTNVFKQLKENSKKLEAKVGDGPLGKFIALYGFIELFDNLPDNLTHILIENKTKNDVRFTLPASIGRFQNLRALMLENVVDEIPDNICQLKDLELLGLPNNKGLKTLPFICTTLPLTNHL